MHGLKNTCARYVAMALWAVEAMMESVVALHAWQILMTIHELFTLWKLFSLLVTWECIFEAQKRLIELPFMHAIQHCKLMHACMHMYYFNHAIHGAWFDGATSGGQSCPEGGV